VHLYETTSTITREEAAPILRYANKAYQKRLAYGTVNILLLLTMLMGWLVYREDPQEALFCVVFVLGMTAVFGMLCLLLSRFSVNPYTSPGELSWTHTTWYDGKNFHRLDADGDEFAWPLKKIRWAWRKGWMLLLCTSSRALIPVNLLNLSQTDRESLLELLRTRCHRLIALE